MENQDPDKTPESALRRRAEARLARDKAARHADERDSRRLVHELQVHQIELEIQNEELREAKDAAETAYHQLARTHAELAQAQKTVEDAQRQLQQSEKMAAIGVLAAGVAHEISNPLSFVSSNLTTLQDYIADFLAFIGDHAPQDDGTGNELGAARQDVLTLMSETRRGIDRIKSIVEGLTTYSRASSRDQWRDHDLHEGLDSTLLLISDELKYKCEIRKEYGQLPPVFCNLNQINQVFLNLLVNAMQSIATHGTVTVRTGTQAEHVWVEIIDTGAGVAPEDIDRLFDPFFTTRPPGQGVGLGLSISYGIVKKHGGDILVKSEPGKGTVFRIVLPISQPD